jgi:hypothetical protein
MRYGTDTTATRVERRADAIIPLHMAETRVPLPAGVREPFTVYVNGVQQEFGRDFHVADGALVFSKELVKAQKLGFWRWFLGAWGIGTYKRNDQIDVAWERDGHPQVAHALDIEPNTQETGL